MERGNHPVLSRGLNLQGDQCSEWEVGQRTSRTVTPPQLRGSQLDNLEFVGWEGRERRNLHF